jgi:hypothetical protein
MAISTSVLELHFLTGTGVLKAQLRHGAAEAEVVATGLDGENVRNIVVDPFNPRHLYACSVTDFYTSQDGGQTWEWSPAGGVDYREIWCLAVHPTRPNVVFLGTMPSVVYVSENGGRSFHELPGFRDLPDYRKWTFPVPPHSPNTRWITLDARVPDEILVGIEEGGVVHSRDNGATWEDISGPSGEGVYPTEIDPEFRVRPTPPKMVDGRVYRDVHRVLRDPTRLDRLYATTGNGLYVTKDTGRWWDRPDYGLERGYAVPMAIHPAVPNRLFLGAAEFGPPSWPGHRYARTGPFNSPTSSRNMVEQTGGARSAILRSDDFGESWRRLQGGLPDANPYMVSGVAMHPDDPNALFVTYTDGQVYQSLDAGESWRMVAEVRDRLYGITAVGA